ncbi:tetratricopeptide repeat protein [Actinoallomurus spadix]|uniref:Tetratricopeptide repeat protein n=1 Tax=Actinoallomurus spadix TaxID=79912 RepID=A0ABN0XGK0_9ACTN|nr:tetratricopeptide repeat protein [Actinoallomurus spadix]MCO5991534.1 tetratricopeptide repeat protein [Actinoallomurus spadix]
MVELNRRRLIAGLGLAAGAAAVTPLLGAPVSAAEERIDPDALLKAGRFDEAARGYEAILRKDPNNGHAARQRGYIALLSNRFADAQKYLTLAVGLAPDDTQAKQWLAECHLRQEDYPPAVPLLRAIGKEAEATWYEAVQGQPYQVSVGPSGRVPWLTMDPLPLIEASVNGGPPNRFLWDTGNTMGVGLTVRMAEEAGLRPVSQTKVNGGDQQGIDGNIPYTRGSINGSGPQVVSVNTGQEGGMAGGLTLDAADRLGVRVDRSRPMYGATHREVLKGYPCYPDEARIGPAIAREIYWSAGDRMVNPTPFDVLAVFGHTFFKPYAVTLDFAEMNLYITGGESSS